MPAHLARLAAAKGFTLLYLSTDYVFDGRNPPYEADSATHPLQMYGRQKLAGEEAIKVAGARACALRVPVLYGRTEYNGESAVNVLVDGECCVRLCAPNPLSKLSHLATPSYLLSCGR